MKNPLIVLAVCAITTFTMGWFGHRVFSKSRAKALQQAQLPAPIEENKKLDSPLAASPDTLVAKNQDTVSTPAPVKETSSPSIHLASAKNDTLWNDPKEIVIKFPDGSVEIKKRFHSTKSFRDYSVEKVSVRPVKALNYSTSKYAKLYKSETRKAAERGVSFAGKYAFASIECGEGCYSSTIVDMKTGKVYDGPHASSGYLYKVNSRLLIVNPPGDNGLYDPCEVCEPELYLWTGQEFRKIKQ